MADDTSITITGNLTADPEARDLPNGGKVVSFTVAHQTRVFDQQANQFSGGRTSFFRCQAFRQLGENIFNGARKGQRVIVTGVINQRQWQAPDGTNRSTFEVTVQDFGISLMFAGHQSNGPHPAPGQYAQQPSNQPPAYPQQAPAPSQPAADNNDWTNADPGFASFGN